eukprot:TRINITY_DN12177_c0_g4_i1.p1 TRINITY_DN12177_c0_g4~~TRINITY_DN12177_c0_g4_i1.p1  ORF type:complete len:272 (+),score=48.19 TRINITY_DN12177_c0_g4_i1:58-873(+)
MSTIQPLANLQIVSSKHRSLRRCLWLAATFTGASAVFQHFTFLLPCSRIDRVNNRQLRSAPKKPPFRGNALLRQAAEQAAPGSSELLLAAVREAVAERGGATNWEDAASAIADAAAVGKDEAEVMLAKAFGWKGWFELNRPVYLKPKLPPDASQVVTALEWLSKGPLALTPEQLRHALSVKPLAYLINPAESYTAALSIAPEQFSEASSFRELLLREPLALDLTHNCERTDPAERPLDAFGEAIHCDGQCTKCWRTVTPRFMGQVLDGVEV